MKNPRHLLPLGLALLASFTGGGAARAVTILHNFTFSATDGRYPNGELTLSGSTLYGMSSGGSSSNGAVFKVNTDGSGFGLVHSFAGSPSDGSSPKGALTLVGSTLYGTTEISPQGLGTIFSVNTDGSGYHIVHQFTSNGSEGNNPVTPPIVSGTTLYGVTSQGGATANNGAIYRLNTSGTGLSLLHSFNGGVNDGLDPEGGLLLSGAKLFGLTRTGGTSNKGVLFGLNTDGTGFSLLHSFTDGASDGAFPEGSLTLIGTKLYGLTRNGGSGSSGGTIFSINTDGTGFSLLHSFVFGSSDGFYPGSTLTAFGAKLFGTVYSSSPGSGTLFSINTDGSGFATLNQFGGTATDGANPVGAPTLSVDGTTLYGVTQNGGSTGRGTVFSASAPEPSSAALLLGSGLLLFRRNRRS